MQIQPCQQAVGALAQHRSSHQSLQHSKRTKHRDAIRLLLNHLQQHWHNVKTSCGAHRQRHSLEKTKDWIKDAAAIMGQSVKSGVGRGPPPDEERPLLPEHAQNPPVSLRPACHLAIFGVTSPFHVNTGAHRRPACDIAGKWMLCG